MNKLKANLPAILDNSPSTLTQEAIPIVKVIELLKEAMTATKTTYNRDTGQVISPDWDARLRAIQLRLQLGGELEKLDKSPDEVPPTFNIFLDGKQIKSKQAFK